MIKRHECGNKGDQRRNENGRWKFVFGARAASNVVAINTRFEIERNKIARDQKWECNVFDFFREMRDAICGKNAWYLQLQFEKLCFRTVTASLIKVSEMKTEEKMLRKHCFLKYLFIYSLMSSCVLCSHAGAHFLFRSLHCEECVQTNANRPTKSIEFFYWKTTKLLRAGTHQKTQESTKKYMQNVRNSCEFRLHFEPFPFADTRFLFSANCLCQTRQTAKRNKTLRMRAVATDSLAERNNKFPWRKPKRNAGDAAQRWVHFGRGLGLKSRKNYSRFFVSVCFSFRCRRRRLAITTRRMCVPVCITF